MSSSGGRFTDVELENIRLPACYGYFSWKLLTLEEAMGELRDILPDINRYVKMAKRHCIFPNDHKLTKDEAATIYLYTMEMSDDACVYRILNQTLRVEDRSKVRPWFAYLKLLDSATSKLPQFKGTVWRGVNKDVSQTFRKGQRITWWSVSSCSASVDVISTFIGKVPQSTLFYIDCVNGKSIATYTCYPNENEVILMPGTIFEVVADPLHHHGGLHIIHLKEIIDDDDDNDEQQDSSRSNTASPLATLPIAEKFSNMSLGIIPNIPANARWAENGITVAGGYGRGDASNQLDYPYGLYLDDDQTVYIADRENHRIVEWKPGTTRGQIVAGGNGSGTGTDKLYEPADVFVDKATDSLIICDKGNQRVMRWSRRNQTSGDIIIDNIDCYGVTMDDQRFLYVCDCKKHEVRRYKIGEKNGIVVAGGNGKGNRLNQLDCPCYVFVDRDYSVYVSEWNNHRVMKWMKGAKEGIVVAGGQGERNDLAQLANPRGVFVDQLGTVYVSESNNNRVTRWRKGAKEGCVIVGGNGSGTKPNQLSQPDGLSFDRHGNLYVVDFENSRVQRFSIQK